MATNPITRKRNQLSKTKRVKKKLKIPREKTIKPPETRRYCLGCNKITTFQYRPVIGHSRCSVCEGSFSRKIDPSEDKEMLAKTEKAKPVKERNVFTSKEIIKNNTKWLKFARVPVIVEAFRTEKDFYIETLEGVMKASRGDWVIKGIMGECYPCKHAIFEKIYQRVSVEEVK